MDVFIVDLFNNQKFQLGTEDRSVRCRPFALLPFRPSPIRRLDVSVTVVFLGRQERNENQEIRKFKKYRNFKRKVFLWGALFSKKIFAYLFRNLLFSLGGLALDNFSEWLSKKRIVVDRYVVEEPRYLIGKKIVGPKNSRLNFQSVENLVNRQ